MARKKATKLGVHLDYLPHDVSYRGRESKGAEEKVMNNTRHVLCLEQEGMDRWTLDFASPAKFDDST
jgi:hypothetical protein